MDSKSIQIGDVLFDLYEVKGIHGGGGMGVVYRVLHRGWGIDLAMKSPRAKWFATDEGRENFVAEAERWVALGLHPHVVSCHYVRVLEGVPRIFAEYVEGGTLEAWIGKRLSGEGALSRILDVAIQMAWGIGFAHEQDLIHQDIKPANVLMTPEGAAKVADFGLARARARAGAADAEAATGHSVIVPGGGLCTVAYAAPEQLEKRGVSRVTDVFSWAATVVEMFAGGRRWMIGPAAAGALDKLAKNGPPDPAIPRMPEGLKSLLDRCLSSNPAARPHDFGEIAGALLAIHREATGTDHARPLPQTAALRADTLNNRAVSLLDLGRREEAERLFAEALAEAPRHVQATYNQGLCRLRDGRMSDDAFVLSLVEAKGAAVESWEAEVLLAWVHLGRGALDEARSALARASKWGGRGEAILAVERELSASERGYRRRGSLYEGGEYAEGLAVSTGGKLVISANRDGKIRVWDLPGERLVAAWKKPAREGGEARDHVAWRGLSATREGDMAIACDGSERVYLWEVPSGRLAQSLTVPGARVWSVALAPDGRLAATGEADGKVRIWEVDSGRCIATLEGHTSCAGALALSADGTRLLSGDNGGRVKVWEVASGRCSFTLEAHRGLPVRAISSVCFALGDRFALSASMDECLFSWDLATGARVHALVGHTAAIESVSASAGHLAISGGFDRTVRVWDLAAGRCLRTFAAGSLVDAVAVDPAGRVAVSSRRDGSLDVWEIPPRTAVAPFAVVRPFASDTLLSHEGRFRSSVASAREALARGDVAAALAAARAAREVPGRARDPEVMALWDDLFPLAARGALRGTSPGPVLHYEWASKSDFMAAAVAAQGRIALTSEGRGVHVWDLASGKLLRSLWGHKEPVCCAAITSDGKLAVSGGWDGMMYVWDVAAGRSAAALKACSNGVLAVALTPDGRLAAASSYTEVKVYDLARRDPIQWLRGHNGQVRAVALHPDGGSVLWGGDDGLLRRGDVATGRDVCAWSGHQGAILALATTPDGRRAASIGADGTIRIWQVETGECLHLLQGAGDSSRVRDSEKSYAEAALGAPVRGIAISADGAAVLSADGERLRIWDVASGRAAPVVEQPGRIGNVAMTPDARVVVWAGNPPRLWHLDWDLVSASEPRA